MAADSCEHSDRPVDLCACPRNADAGARHVAEVVPEAGTDFSTWDWEDLLSDATPVPPGPESD